MITIIAIAFIVLLTLSILLGLTWSLCKATGDDTGPLIYWFIGISVGWIAFFNIGYHVLK